MPNPALQPLGFLIGEWRTTGSHPMRPGRVLDGRASFRWDEGGAFLMMRTQVADPDFRDGVAVIGSDDATGTFTMTYFDQRGVSRIYDVVVGDQSVTWRRDDPKLSQVNTISVGDGADTLVGKGRMAEGGGDWSDDLSQFFHRMPPVDPLGPQ